MTRKKWMKWLGRLLLAVVFSLVTRTVWLVGERQWVRAEGDRELTTAFAETDAADPGWRWEALAAARRIPPTDGNAAALIPRIKARLPPDWVRFDNPKKWEPTPPPQPPNRLFPEETIASTRRELGLAPAAVELARTLKDFPDGNRVIHLTPDVLSTKLQDTQDTRTVAALLRWDVVLAAADGDRGRAADDLLALLNTSRSVGDEPFLISQLVRIATRTLAARSVEYVLGQVELADPRLAALQAAWANDAEEPLLLYGLRGERAAFDVLFRNLADGTATPTSAAKSGDAGLSFEAYTLWLYRGRFPRERAAYHRWVTRGVEAARLPLHEQPAAIGALPPPPGDDMKLARLFIPAVEKIAAADWRSVAEARCVVVALACERYRLKNKRWPGSLSDLPNDRLPAVPLDPYDGQPLRYKSLADGAVVYSVGKDGTDDGGLTSEPGNPAGTDIGIRLWNPAARGLPAVAVPLTPSP